jgi:flagellar motor switch protein FliN/FliY
MSLISDLAATNDIAMTVAGAIERVLGNEVILAVGLPREESPDTEVLPPGETRTVAAALDGSASGCIAVIVGPDLARALESSAEDEQVTTALGETMAAAAAELVRLSSGGLTVGEPTELPTADLLGQATEGEFLVYPLLDGTERVACLVINVAAVDAAAEATADQPASVAVHEFQPLDGLASGLVDPRPLTLLADVEMGVTAELGRRRMSVRDLLGLTPGAVIELDRAAGAPVDVLVNGTLIARGEVVVVDEEFGIRISEIVAADAAAH